MILLSLLNIDTARCCYYVAVTYTPAINNVAGYITFSYEALVMYVASYICT